MIKDFQKFADGSIVTTDFCIIGAGAAGITIAREFLGTRYTTVILESGGLHPESETQKLYDSEVVGLPHAGVHNGRARVFGGTTTLWGGQALRFDTFDLKERSWVPYSGWPLSRVELDPYYERADRVLQLGASIPYNDLCASFGIEPPAFDPAKLYTVCSRWSPKPNFSTTYGDELKNAQNISVLLHANVTAIITNEAATAVENVEFRTFAGKQGKAVAKFYVICCGGIETARLLLASDRIEQHGVGNRNDLVGRYFQEHLHIRYGDLLTNNRKHLQDLFESFYKSGLKYMPLVTLSEHLQAEKKLLKIHGATSFDNAINSGIAAVKSLYKTIAGRTYHNSNELRRLVWSALRDPGELLNLAYRFYVQKRAGTSKLGPIFFGAQCETAPNPNSRVTLADVRDQLGMRRVRLNWQFGELERRTASEYLRTIWSEFARLGLGEFDSRYLTLLDDRSKWIEMTHDSAHHMGTTRMHENPQLGVVDANCQIHGLANLYIGSSAVFPTSACSNPTLTILALCLRIADRLKQIS
jgi:choline dehydrogenase-like flavoprotein